MAARKHATNLKITLGRRLLRYELRVGNLGITFLARSSEPVEVEFRDLGEIVDPFAASEAVIDLRGDAKAIERQIADAVAKKIRRTSPMWRAITDHLTTRAKPRKAVRRG